MGITNINEVVLLGTTTSGAGTFTGPDINVVQGWQSAIVSLNPTAAGGTSLDVWIQKKVKQAAAADLAAATPSGTAVYDDILHFTQITASTAIRFANLSVGYAPVNTANATTLTTADWAQQDAALGAGTIRLGPLGGLWRVKWTQVGAGYTFTVSVQLVPFGAS